MRATMWMGLKLIPSERSQIQCNTYDYIYVIPLAKLKLYRHKAAAAEQNNQEDRQEICRGSSNAIFSPAF